jgi:glycerol-3-phosphate dehydrogenase (NAD(P)+)
MSRATREIAKLIKAMGGNELSAYGLCHLGDYEATVFSPHSHNRRFGEMFVRGERYTELAEGYSTILALMELSRKYEVELPICGAVYEVVHKGKRVDEALSELFLRNLKPEF